MELRDLFAGAEVSKLSGPVDANITSITYDSRKIVSGSIFFALKGEKVDGAQFAAEAIRRGAIAVASESPAPSSLPSTITWLQLSPRSDRRSLAIAAANFFGRPGNALKLIGVTGTNGKTTTTFLMDSIIRAAGQWTGLIGTTGYRTPKGQREAINTTPESLDLQEMFAEVRDAGGTHVVLEASSHALAMDRLWGCHFAVAIFTNLTRDHLDFHKNFDDYFVAKRRLFEGTGAGVPDCAVINTDDPHGHLLKDLARETLTYGLENGAQITTKKLSVSFSGLEFVAQTPAGKIDIRSRLVGRMNVYNILGAIGASLALKIPVEQIQAGIQQLQSVPGRFQTIDEGQPFLVVVDYAHTDDALRNVLNAAREVNQSARLIILFGAGGERDRAKRPIMGEVAGSLADLVVLTSDNPRSEDPLRIINDVVVGLQKANANYRIEPDRGRAIEMALEEARTGDIVILAGKGHENYQVLRDRSVPFDDREIARNILRRRYENTPVE